MVFRFDILSKFLCSQIVFVLVARRSANDGWQMAEICRILRGIALKLNLLENDLYFAEISI
jgi:hypothetical protein